MKSRNWWIKLVLEIESFQFAQIVLLSLDDPIGRSTAELFANRIKDNWLPTGKVEQDSDESCANEGTHFSLGKKTQVCVFWEDLGPIEDLRAMRLMQKAGAKVQSYNL